MKKFNFEWLGNHPAADFVNTLDERPSTNPLERLDGYEALIEFAQQAQLVENNMATRVLKATNERTASKVHSAALQFREALFDVLLAMSAGRRPPATSLTVVEEEIHRAHGARHLTSDASPLTWSWHDPTESFLPLWELALATERLLLFTESQRIKKCAANDCGVIFIDSTKAGSRRWCSMTSCGNRSKVRKFRSSHSKSGQAQ